MPDEPLTKQIFMALAEAMVEVQDRFGEGRTADEIVPLIIEALVELSYYTAHDGAGLSELGFLGLCTAVVLNPTGDRPRWPEGQLEVKGRA